MHRANTVCGKLARAGGWLALAMVTNAGAQVLEEVVVTAQKREQALGDVGISVTAFSDEQIKALGVSGTQDIDSQTPGLLVTDYGGGVTTVFTVRGAGQLDFNDQQEGPVAVYIDGAYVSFLAGVGFNFFDLERIEVLRGPQGTLFGRNATAGLVQLVSKKPSDELEGYVELTGGERGKFVGEAAVSGPLTDTIKGRLSIYHEETNGYVENSLGPNSNVVDNNGGRAQIHFTPNEQFDVLLAGRWSIDDAFAQIYDIKPAANDVVAVPGTQLVGDGFIKSVDAPSFLEYCSNIMPNVFFIAGVNPVLGATDCFGNFNPDSPYKAAASLPTHFDREHYGFTATMNYDFGFATATSITDWQDFKKRYLEDSDSTPLDLFHFVQNQDATQISQELRIANKTDWGNWVIGGYFLNIDSSGNTGVDAVGSLGVGFDNLYALDTTTYAGFFQVEYNFSEQWSGILGFRWTEDDKDFELTPRCTFLPNFAGANFADCGFLAPLVQGIGLPKTNRSEGDWSGNVEIDWRPNDDWLVYFKVVRGHKAGGFNGGILSFFTIDAATYDAELPVSYEGGFKATLFDGKARLNTSVFYTDYKDFQTFSQIGANLIVFNIDAEVTGAEFELTLNPWEGWDFLFGLSLLDGEQKDLEGPGGVIDRPMPNAPDLAANGLGRYAWPVFGGSAFAGEMSLQLDVNYVEGRSLSALNHPALQGDAYIVGNARIGWRSEDDHWQLQLWVRNLNDEVYYPTTFDISGITGVVQPVVASPRWFGGTVTYRW